MTKKKSTLNRRDFIRAGTLAGGGLLIAISIPFRHKLFAKSSPFTFAPNSFLLIGEGDSIEIILSRVEMGKGFWRTMPMLVAEELV